MNDVAKPVKVKATVMWCFHNKINSMAKRYTIDLCNLSPNAVKAIESLGLSVSKREDKPEKGFFITCKSTIPFEIFDSSGNDLKDVAIGNGSTATAVVGTYEWAWKNKKGISPSATKLVIDSLVAYEEGQATEEALDEVL